MTHPAPSKTQQIIDITLRMTPGMPVWPGDTPFTMEQTMTISDDCPVNVSKLTLSPHTGTHMDSAFHYDPNGCDTADMPLDAYIGPALVVDAVGCGPLVMPDHIMADLPDHVERVLIKTTDTCDEGRWPEGFTALHHETVTLLASRGVRCIGIDTPSMDPQNSKDMPAHQTICKHGIAILESLKLVDVTPDMYELIALPLKIAGCDGSPVRAILRPLD